MENEFLDSCYIIRDKESNFVYGECEGIGTDFEMAIKFNDYDEAKRFINHNNKYNNDNWKIFKVNISYKILV